MQIHFTDEDVSSRLHIGVDLPGARFRGSQCNERPTGEALKSLHRSSRRISGSIAFYADSWALDSPPIMDSRPDMSFLQPDPGVFGALKNVSKSKFFP